ncbi:hypothetical protein PENSPDRAFT_649972 [Peniophora sp. CONT]|nr:hypothetical protein PENSPDRAFT_649972 [Peniophora sp. CONT]
MSGPVRNHSRRLRATALASPYAKKVAQPTKQSSGWSIGGIFSALNFFKRGQSSETDEGDYEQQQRDEEEDDEEDERPYTPPPPAAALSMRGREMAGETPSKPIDIDALSSSPSNQGNNAEVVARYLAESKGRSLAEQEISTLVSLLRSPTTDEQMRPPRKLELSPAPSPSSLRAAAPLPFSFAAPPSPAPANPFDFTSISQPQPEPKPKRTLPRDPNAPTYKFTGAGSAKQNSATRPRTRYVSPAFGSPARGRASPAGTIALSPPPVQKGDAKRRKLEERAAGVTSPVSSPVKAKVNANGGEEKEKEKEDEPQMPATPRPRHAVAVVRAGMGAPAVPSPLRNGWHASPDSSPGSPSASSAKKPVTNANGLSGLGMATPNKPRASPSITANGNGSPMSMSTARSLNGDDKEKDKDKRATPTKAAATLSALIAQTAPPPPPRPEVANPYQAALPARVQQKRPVRKRKVEDIFKARSGSGEDDGGKEGGKKGGDEEEIGLDRIIEATVPKGSKRARPPPDLAPHKSTPASEPRRSARLKSPEPSAPASKPVTYRSLFAGAGKEKDVGKDKPKPNGAPIVEEINGEDDEDVEIIEASPPKKAKTSAFGTSTGASFGTASGGATATLGPHNGATATTYRPPGSGPGATFSSANPFTPPNSFSPGAGKPGGFGGLGNGLPSSKPSSAPPEVSVEEVPTSSSAPGLVAKPTEVIEPEESPKKEGSGAGAGGKNKPPAFAPRAPSKLRFAVQAEEKEAEEMEGVQQENEVKEKVANSFSFQTTPAVSSTPSNAAVNAKDPKAAAAALAVPTSSLPTFTFHIVSASGPITPSTSGSMDVDQPVKDDKAKEAARKVDISTLPTFAFNASLPASSPGAGPSKLSSSTSTNGGVGFNWAAAGMKPPAQSEGSWTCGVCAVTNKPDASKCAACEEPAPKPKSASSAPGSGGFNWAAAGIKPPVKDAGGWTCGVCAVTNKEGVAKCVACEEPAPKSASGGGAGGGGGFNWAAAGMKAPIKDVGGWTCGVCMVPNKEGVGKCVACDSDRA